MDMFAQALQIQLSSQRHVYLYNTLYNRLLQSKQLYNIKHTKQLQCCVQLELQLKFLL